MGAGYKDIKDADLLAQMQACAQNVCSAGPGLTTDDFVENPELFNAAGSLIGMFAEALERGRSTAQSPFRSHFVAAQAMNTAEKTDPELLAPVVLRLNRK